MPSLDAVLIPAIVTTIGIAIAELVKRSTTVSIHETDTQVQVLMETVKTQNAKIAAVEAKMEAKMEALQVRDRYNSRTLMVVSGKMSALMGNIQVHGDSIVAEPLDRQRLSRENATMMLLGNEIVSTMSRDAEQMPKEP